MKATKQVRKVLKNQVKQNSGSHDKCSVFSFSAPPKRQTRSFDEDGALMNHVAF